jgi:hypothetical protein
VAWIWAAGHGSAYHRQRDGRMTSSLRNCSAMDFDWLTIMFEFMVSVSPAGIRINFGNCLELLRFQLLVVVTVGCLLRDDSLRSLNQHFNASGAINRLD